MATPQAGAELASLLDRFRTLFGATVSMEELRAHDAQLHDLFNWYRNHAPELRIETRSYFETRAVGNVLLIVNPTSAHPGVGEDPVGLDEDHLSISKPRQRESQVCEAVREWVRGLLELREAAGKSSGGPMASRTRPGPADSGSPAPSPPSAGPALPAPTPVYLVQTPSVAAAPLHVPHQLPPAASWFFGRAAALKRLVERLERGQTTAVVGPAGMGKTALEAVAGWLAEFAPEQAAQNKWRRERSALLNRQGDVLVAQGELEAALRSYQVSLGIIRKLLESNSVHAGWKQHLSVSLEKNAWIKEERGQLSGALELELECLAIREKLALLDPSNAVWKNDLLYSRNFVARLREKLPKRG